MPTVTRTIAEQTAPANQESHSATRTVPASLKGILVTLSSTEWAAKAGTGRVLWGIQLSYDGGTTWGPGSADDPRTNRIGGASLAIPAWIYVTNTIGDLHPRNGTLPHFSFSGDQISNAVGALVRLFAYPEVPIALGADLVATT